jgi:hypothetical protein
MKKNIFILFAALPLITAAQNKLDTVVLKNGKSIPGCIYKMEEGKIFIAAKTDSFSYKAEEVKSIIFCHKVRGNGPSYSSSASQSSGSGKSAGGTGSISNSSSNYSYSGKPGVDNIEEKGTVVFRCNMCGGEGSLQITGSKKDSKATSRISFTLNKDEHNFSHEEHLIPGEYSWTYSDTNKNMTKGKFTIQKRETKKIVLFENE